MSLRHVKVQAENKEQALEKAEGLLNTDPGNIYLEELSDQEFAAQLINADAEIFIKVNEESMTASIERVHPHSGNGKQLSLKLLIKSLEKAGIGVDFDKEAASIFLEYTECNEDVRGLIVARGIDIKPGRDAELMIIGDLSYPVFPGDIFIRKIPVIPAKSGIDLSGAPIYPSDFDQPLDIRLQDTDEFSFDAERGVLVSKVYGLAIVQDKIVSIEPLLEIHEERMCAHLIVTSKDFKGKEINTEILVKFLKEKGINTVNNLETSIKSALKKLRKTNQAQEKIIAALGIPPRPGKDSYLHLKGKLEKEIGKEREDGSMDYHDRGEVWCVDKGDLIGYIVPFVEGRPGVDIFGNPTDVPHVNKCFIKAGDNVSVSENQETMEYFADDEGMVVFSQQTLSVLPSFEIDGNIDNYTGDIESSRGSVIVKGSVLTGFTITCPGNIVVEEVVEGAVLTAGGSINIHGGAVMGYQGEVRAEGDIAAHFATNARVFSSRNLYIGSALTNSEAQAGEKVVCTDGPGVIRGGSTHAGTCIEANEIGSESGVPTLVALDIVCDNYNKDLEAQKDLEAKVDKILTAFGDKDLNKLLLELSSEKASKIKILMASLKHSNDRLKDLSESIQEAQNEFWSGLGKRIIVNKMLHANTTIRFGKDHVLKVNDPVPRCMIYFDHTLKKIRIAPLD
ncbi:MAG: hypothetical protein ACI9S8_000783 [Chlamydiales bacterium]|jgi:uncharacterized protein (DUF342 family)